MATHNLHPNIVLAYHGCDESVGRALLEGEAFRKSKNDYDWLGGGIYFWEANPVRALSFAQEQKRRNRVRKPFVVGAAITLGNCIDTLNEESIRMIAAAHRKLAQTSRLSGEPLPRNGGGRDLLLKRLDCAVIMALHEMLEEAGLPPADSLRGLYYEGERLYDESSFYEKSHVQICIRNPDCIKGVFLPKAGP
jgi:hypothetical protein